MPGWSDGGLYGLIGAVLIALIGGAWRWVMTSTRLGSEALRAQRDDLTSAELKLRGDLMAAYEQCQRDHESTRNELDRYRRLLDDARERITRLEQHIAAVERSMEDDGK